MSQTNHEVQLILPAERVYAPVASMAMSSLGMVLGLDVDVLGDLRTVCCECIDCLLHQAGRPRTIAVKADVCEKQLRILFSAEDREAGTGGDELSLEITRCVLETLMPRVELFADDLGVHGIRCAMPV